MTRTSPHGRSQVVDLARVESRSPAETRAYLRLLDGFELGLGDLRPSLPAGSQRLLAYLALQEQPVSRHQVALVLWPESTDRQAAANLRTALWRLRRPGMTSVETRGDALGLHAGLRVDVRELIEIARAIASSPDPWPGGPVHPAALAGDLLPGWYEDWVVSERERIRQLRLHALDALCARLTTAGRHAEAVEVGLRAVQVEPLRESAHMRLIEAHLAEGNRVEAIRQYEALGTLLLAELGIEPAVGISELIPGITTPSVTHR